MSGPYHGFCPAHEQERAECTPECKALKDEMWRINQDYTTLWYDRRRGVRPETPAYRVATGRLGAAIRGFNKVRAA
jgi:hypothetical protein